MSLPHSEYSTVSPSPKCCFLIHLVLTCPLLFRRGSKKAPPPSLHAFQLNFNPSQWGIWPGLCFWACLGFFPSSRRMTHFTIWQKSPRCCDLAAVNYRRHSNKGKGMYLKKIQKSEWTIISFELPDSIKENSVFSSSSSSPSSMSTREKREAVGHFSKSLSLSVDSR